jgi:DNA-directed RNA polymerase specialized sigma24 family protein
MSAIMSERRQLINLTYRLLGSLAEAEDAVQETYARWYALSRPEQDAIESPGAWLTTVASRICLNVLGSARAGTDRVDRRAARRRRGPGRPGHPG